MLPPRIPDRRSRCKRRKPISDKATGYPSHRVAKKRGRAGFPAPGRRPSAQVVRADTRIRAKMTKTSPAEMMIRCQPSGSFSIETLPHSSILTSSRDSTNQPRVRTAPKSPCDSILLPWAIRSRMVPSIASSRPTSTGTLRTMTARRSSRRQGALLGSLSLSMRPSERMSLEPRGRNERSRMAHGGRSTSATSRHRSCSTSSVEEKSLPDPGFSQCSQRADVKRLAHARSQDGAEADWPGLVVVESVKPT